MEPFISTGSFQLVLTGLGTVILPVAFWFATMTSNRLKTLDDDIKHMQNDRVNFITRDEFMNRMDRLEDRIMKALTEKRQGV